MRISLFFFTFIFTVSANALGLPGSVFETSTESSSAVTVVKDLGIKLESVDNSESTNPGNADANQGRSENPFAKVAPNLNFFNDGKLSPNIDITFGKQITEYRARKKKWEDGATGGGKYVDCASVSEEGCKKTLGGGLHFDGAVSFNGELDQEDNENLLNQFAMLGGDINLEFNLTRSFNLKASNTRSFIGLRTKYSVIEVSGDENTSEDDLTTEVFSSGLWLGYKFDRVHLAVEGLYYDAIGSEENQVLHDEIDHETAVNYTIAIPFKPTDDEKTKLYFIWERTNGIGSAKGDYVVRFAADYNFIPD